MYTLATPSKKKQSPLDEMYNLYGTSVQKQAGDYDDIMGKYRNIYDESGPGNESRYSFNPYQADQATYRKSSDTTAALANLNELSRTGGLSGTDQQNLRARGVSPIRAQYATTQRDMDRQRRLNGGYSPNFGAVTAKMTRDQSSAIADQMDKVNANIAQMVQSGRLSAAPNYASAAQNESELAHSIETGNVNARNDANRFNATGIFESKRQQRGDRLGAANGMTNLYGTTPALSNLYGSQALDTAKFEQGVKQQKKSNALDAFRGMYRA